MEWKEVRLGDIVEIVNGFAFKSKAFTLDGIPVIKIKNIKAGKVILNDLDYISTSDINPKYTKIRSSDILITMTGNRMDGSPETWVGKVSLFRHQGDFYLNQRVSALRLIDDSVDNNFLSYYLSSWQSQLYFALNSNSSGGQANITPAVVNEYRLMVPELETQRCIASILSSLDRKIELNNKINADLEEMAQAIFKNWFVDFEPFKDGKFVDSELGMIPEGWKVISLNEILDNVSGYSYKGSELQSSNIAMATIKNFERKGGFKTEGYKEIVISKKIKETQFVNMFDVLVAHTDLTQNAEIVGNPAIVLSKGGYEKLIMSMDLTKVISKIDGITNGLLYCILSTSRFKEHALGYVNGTTVLHMSKKAVPEYTCAFPKDINQIRDLCITLDSIYKRMAVTYEENSRLSLLRDTLLPRLMSGELEISE